MFLEEREREREREGGEKGKEGEKEREVIIVSNIIITWLYIKQEVKDNTLTHTHAHSLS